MPDKPVPPATYWTDPYWKAAREGRLILQKCQDCGKYIFYPRINCPFCFSERIEWVPSSGKGKVYSYTVVLNNAPSAFIGDMPFVISIVKLDEGVQMLTNIVGCRPDEVYCEMPVEVTFERISESFTLPKFKPAGK